MTFNGNVSRSITQATNAVSSPTFDGTVSKCTTVPGWNVVEYAGKGLLALDCTKDGTRCWAGGATSSSNPATGGSYLV